MKYLRHTHLVCDPITSQMIDTGQYTFNIFFHHISFLLYFFLPPVLSLIVSIYSFWYYFILRISSLWSFFFSFPFFLVSSILPILLFYFSSFSVQCLFHTRFVDSYTSFVIFYTNIPPFRKPFRASLTTPLFSYDVACLASYPLHSKASSPQSAS
jgi:hypothetical protein